MTISNNTKPYQDVRLHDSVTVSLTSPKLEVSLRNFRHIQRCSMFCSVLEIVCPTCPVYLRWSCWTSDATSISLIYLFYSYFFTENEIARDTYAASIKVEETTRFMFYICFIPNLRVQFREKHCIVNAPSHLMKTARIRRILILLI